MPTVTPWHRPTRYPEAVLLGLVAHELIGGGVFWLVGMPGIGTALWAVGTGLTVGYLIVWLVREHRRPHEVRRLLVVGASLVIMAATAALGWYVVSCAFGVVLLTVILWAERPTRRFGNPPLPISGDADENSGVVRRVEPAHQRQQ